MEQRTEVLPLPVLRIGGNIVTRIAIQIGQCVMLDQHKAAFRTVKLDGMAQPRACQRQGTVELALFPQYLRQTDFRGQRQAGTAAVQAAQHLAELGFGRFKPATAQVHQSTLVRQALQGDVHILSR
jgi:hypothetical protein